MANYSSYAAVINGVPFSDIAMAEPDIGSELMTIQTGGLIDPINFSLAFKESKVELDTHDLSNVFGGSSLNVNPLLGLRCKAPSIFQWQKALDGGFSIGSDHFTVSSPEGYLYVQEISADQDAKEPANCKMQYCFLEEGGVYATLSPVASLAGSPGLLNYYGLGPLYINGAKVPGILRGKLTTGIRYKLVRTDGNIVASEGIVEDRNLQLDFDLNDLTIVSTLGWGIANAAGPVSWYLQKCVSGGGRVSYSTSEHIKLTFDSSVIEVRGISRGQKTDAVAKLIVHLKSSGFSGSVGSSIP